MSQLEGHLADAGFCNISVRIKEESRALIDSWMPGESAGEHVLSAVIQATKPLDANGHAASVANVAPVEQQTGC